MQAIKILLVDDEPRNRLTLKKWLDSPDLLLLEADSGEEALELVLQHEFALILLDIEMSEMDGFETAEFIRNNPDSQTIPIMFVTGVYTGKESVFKGYEVGAVDYLLKPIDPHILKSKVNFFVEAYQEKTQLENEITDLRKQSGTHVNAVHPSLDHLLSPRETQVLELIVAGKSSKIIAFDLGVSEHTVNAHRRNIMAKLDVHDLASLVSFALIHQLVNPKTV